MVSRSIKTRTNDADGDKKKEAHAKPLAIPYVGENALDPRFMVVCYLLLYVVLNSAKMHNCVCVLCRMQHNVNVNMLMWVLSTTNVVNVLHINIK